MGSLFSTDTDPIFQGAGEMRALCRTFDWSKTSLGAVSGWPQSLRTAVQMVLASPFPNIVLWGDDLLQIYNDGYREVMGIKHPAGLGQPTEECWPEVWHINQPIYQRVREGESFSFEDALYPLSRFGQLEDVWLTLAYSPVLDESGQVGGILVNVFETTDRVLEKRNREQAEQALRQSEQRFSLLVRATSEMVFTMSGDWKRMLQLDGKDYLVSTATSNENWLEEYIPAADRKAVTRAIQKAIEQQAPFEAEHQVMRLDGSLGWVFSRAIPILDEAGQIQQWLGAANDITELKQSQRRQEFLLQFADAIRPLSSPTAVAEVACQMLVEYLNASRAQFSEIEGKPGAEIGIVRGEYIRHGQPMTRHHSLATYGEPAVTLLRGGSLFVLTDAEKDTQLTDAQRKAFLALGSASAVVIPLVKEGCLVATFAVHEGLPRHWTAAEVALTQEVAERTWAAIERARVEEALRVSEARMAVIFECLPVGVGEVNPQGRIVLANKEMGRYMPTGVMPSRDEARQGRWRAYHPDGRLMDPHDYPGARALRGERVLPGIEMLYTQDDGSTIWTHVAAVPIRDSEGRITGQVGIVIDINDLKRAEEAIKQADRRKGEFLAMLAHELRNPMSTVSNGLAMMELVSESNPEMTQLVTMMIRQTDHLVHMVDDLLDVSRISWGKIELDKKRVNLVDVVRQAIEANNSLYQKAGHTLKVDLPTAKIELEGDATRLTQVVSNLLTNAARYTPPGGQVSVLLEHSGEEALLRVRDTGIGLAADQLEAIFELFVQVDNSLARTQGGLGLGLTLVKQLVELHGGRVEAYSPGLNLGSEFRVWLPTLIPAARSQPVVRPKTKTKITGPELLVIDDNADAALTLSMLLKYKGYVVHTRHSGHAGLEAAERLRPSAILLDIGMPELDGYTTCRLLRQQPWGESMVVIALTGYGGEEDKKRAREAGFNAHMVKPVDLNKLITLLAQLLSSDGSKVP